MNCVFGIDLGTTYSCIAYIDEYGKAVVLKNREGKPTTPSVVMVESKENIVVGDYAKDSILTDHDKTVQFIKRKMGKECDTVELNGITYTAPEISAYILKKLAADANAELVQTGIILDKEMIKDVVITCPAYFGMNERQAIKTAGELAGLNVLNIINEPTAAAISYGVSGKNKNETVLVYDLGGGTFDITVMNVSGNNISVICTGGDDQLGGKDWDESLMEYIVERYSEEYGVDVSEDSETISQLYVDVEEWKRKLSSRESITVVVNGPEGRYREEITRVKFEELTHLLLHRTKNLLDDVLKVAADRGYPLSRIDKVLLVGGSTKMPQVAAMLERDYHVTPIFADPDEAVAKGAAIYAANEKIFNDFVLEEAEKRGVSAEELKEENIRTGEVQRKFASSARGYGCTQIAITNVLSRTYGVEARDPSRGNVLRIFNELMINDSLPAKSTDMFSTVTDNQESVIFPLYESRSTDKDMDIEGRKPLTEIEMKFKDRVPKGTKIEMTMALDNSGLLHIHAVENMYGTVLDTTFQLSNQMTEEEMCVASARMSYADVR